PDPKSAGATGDAGQARAERRNRRGRRAGSSVVRESAGLARPEEEKQEMGVPETETRKAKMPMPSASDPSNGFGRFWTVQWRAAAAGTFRYFRYPATPLPRYLPCRKRGPLFSRYFNGYRQHGPPP